MSFLMVDVHPGRCLNHRTVMGGYGSPVTVRCLDYEAVEHVCHFSDPPSPTMAPFGGSYTTEQPKAWVRPENVS